MGPDGDYMTGVESLQEGCYCASPGKQISPVFRNRLFSGCRHTSTSRDE